jgi:hypothetical protein
MGFMYLREKPPKANQIHEVVITLVGPVKRKEFAKFKTNLKALVKGVGGGIGVRGLVDKKTGTLVKRKK